MPSGKTMSVSRTCYARLQEMRDYYGLPISKIVERLLFGPPLHEMRPHEDLLTPQPETIQ